MLTRTGDLVGTLPYMSPEQVRGAREPVDTRADVYALGVLLCELLTGRVPVELSGLSLAESVRAILEREPRLPTALAPGLERELDWITHKALEKDRERRYESAKALGDDVERYLAGETVQAGAPSTIYRVRRAVRRHPAVAFVALLVVVGSLAFAGYQSGVAEEQAALARAARASEARALARAGGIAAEQGDWAAVLDALDEALAIGVEDPADVHLRRVVALVASGRHAAAADALETVETMPGAREHAGRLLLLRGVLALADEETRAEGWRLLETAARLPVPPADAAFAQGLTAPPPTPRSPRSGRPSRPTPRTSSPGAACSTHSSSRAASTRPRTWPLPCACGSRATRSSTPTRCSSPVSTETRPPSRRRSGRRARG